MSEISPASGATEAPPAEEKDPFEGFTSEAFVGGEPEEEKPATAAKPETGAVPAPEAERAVDEGPEGDTEVEPAPRKPQTAQERINELTRARREAERREADLRKQLEELRAAAPKEAPAPKPEAPAPREAAKGPPRPEDFEFGELDAAYIAAVVDYQTDKRLTEFREAQQQERLRAEEETRQRTVQQKFQQQIEAGRQKYADYDEVVVQGAQAGTWPLSETLGLLLVESEVGDDIAYHLASNPDEAESVDRLAPVEQARYFGRLEAKFSAARAAATGGESAVRPATTRAPRAPAPITSARGAGGRFQATAATDDFSAFEAAVTGN